MHDIWNPWHGCAKKSEGCANCYMYFLDRARNIDPSRVFRVKNNFDYPLQKNSRGEYKVKSGETLRVCMTSDFFIEEADQWRGEAWDIIAGRPDVVFYLLTKRPERVAKLLPKNWGGGWENVFFNVTAENQARADERVPLLLDLPFRHKGVMVAPFIGEVSLKKYLKSGAIERVVAGGENYDGSRVLKCEWVEKLYSECVESDTTFCFIETGTLFEKGGKIYRMPDKRLQSKMAFRSGYFHGGRKAEYKLDLPPAQRELTGEVAEYRAHVRRMRQPPNLQRLRQMPQMPERLTPHPLSAALKRRTAGCAPTGAFAFARGLFRAKPSRQDFALPSVSCECAPKFPKRGVFRQFFGIIIYLRSEGLMLKFARKCEGRKEKKNEIRFP